MDTRGIVEQALATLHMQAFAEHLTYIADDIVLDQGQTIDTVVGKGAYQAHIEQIKQLAPYTFPDTFKIISVQSVDTYTSRVHVFLSAKSTTTDPQDESQQKLSTWIAFLRSTTDLSLIFVLGVSPIPTTIHSKTIVLL